MFSTAPISLIFVLFLNSRFFNMYIMEICLESFYWESLSTLSRQRLVIDAWEVLKEHLSNRPDYAQKALKFKAVFVNFHLYWLRSNFMVKNRSSLKLCQNFKVQA